VFWGAIEQVLSGWIFDVLPLGERHVSDARDAIVGTICRGLRLNTSS
jgi:TetR/AcrR family transcriptional regulator, fatty acid metabolism regulator protein